ncbi:Mur ligase family protein [uncultured Methanobacterium sp.]|uniref:Mur ligase family protein n=1 Tax=uncultured Methanobacterium sp. TaxID=176306 RepID=UPI002AA8FF80|nr:Mur ligase family protein [uncultured Methanobacterium sp.]
MVDKMNAAVVGLGVEGVNAVESLLNHDYEVYASDINHDIELNSDKCLDVDLGFHDFSKIERADTVVLSPGLWNNPIFQKLKSNKKLLSDIITSHRSLFTIGVTGTNGKTTTTMMIASILQKAGMKVLIGGNAGGGFKGYTEVILEAASGNYDILLVEVCDMTLDFCNYNFDFDLIVVTNVGRDHLEFHRSVENYLQTLGNFVKDKKVVLNETTENLGHFNDKASETHFFTKIPYELNLFGDFNRENAGAASKAAEIVGIPDETITTALKEFSVLPGRATIIDLPHSKIVVGKTDNADAAAAVLNEADFPVIILGTPRKGELCRLEIFREASKTNSKIIAIFPGLDDTRNDVRKVLMEEKYPGIIHNLSNVDDVVQFALKCSQKYNNVFIGGNGQRKIIEITESLKEAISAK